MHYESKHSHKEEASPYSEHKIESLEDLEALMKAMDEDEGIRIRGKVEGFNYGGFIFIAKSSNRYCINICDSIYDSIKKTYNVGGRDEWFFFDTFDEAWKKLIPLIRNPLEAYAY